eukprot:TRINITY_DN53939_c0_g1_i1.p1 TRINITY_DN53939_c0_g1~~TRINITY_DN53939_c0_g1_i1.p1  ORF type:complete len:243 (+),score=47.12 TRINITY_DN53939_c0_g1_i1:58-729(+)
MAELQVPPPPPSVGYERPLMLGTGSERTAPEREVSESVYLLLQAEMASSLRERLGLEVAMAKLQATGFTTGVRLMTRLTAARFPITTERTAMKYVCKDLWTYLFKKPANRLQTDRHGSYIIQDWSFRWLEHFQPASGTAAANSKHVAELQETAQLHLALPCGLVQGALHGLGLESIITAEVSAATLPSCSFTVTLKGSEGAVAGDESSLAQPVLPASSTSTQL